MPIGLVHDHWDYHIPLELERPSPSKNERTAIRVRLSDSQVVNRIPEHAKSLARWTAERRLAEHFSRRPDNFPPGTMEASEEEVQEFFQDVDPKKVDENCDRWMDVPPPGPKRIGF